MTKDDLRDGLALVSAILRDDTEGARVIKRHARRAGLVDALTVICAGAARIMADADGITHDELLDRIGEASRRVT